MPAPIRSYSCCTFRGNLVVVKASDGSEVWRTYTTPERSPRGRARPACSTTALRRHHLVVTDARFEAKARIRGCRKWLLGPDIKTADAVIAMDMETGKIKWSQQTAPDMFNWGCAARNGDKGNCPKMRGPTSISAVPVWSISAEANRCWSRGKNQPNSTAGSGQAQDRVVHALWCWRPGRGVQWGIAAEMDSCSRPR
jgi:polyvinyl alcohol dehydrogenase (cytochrome)